MDLHTFHREFTEDFIALYKSLPCLWNTKLKDYTNRKKKSKAYEKLAILQRQVNPKASRETAVKKINSLRTTYRRERKKVDFKRQKNELYVPNLWYYDLMTFVDDGDEGSEDVQYEEEEMLDEEYLDDYKPPSIPATKVKPELVHSSITSQHSSYKKMKADKNFTSQSDDDEDIKSSGGTFVHFGRYIAQVLDRLPDGMAVYCQKLINDTIFEAQMGTLSAKSRIVNNFLNLDQNTSSYEDEENNI